MAIVVTEETFGTLSKVKFAGTSEAGGTAAAVTTKLYTGVLVEAIFIPDSGGTQPTDLYDLTVKDEDNADILVGYGANLSNAAAVYKSGELMGFVNADKLTLAGANIGNAKGFTAILYIAEQ